MSDGADGSAGMCGRVSASIPITGVAITQMSSDAEREIVCVSDDVIAEVEQLQFALGEGPVLDTFLSGRPTLIPDVTSALISSRWPVFSTALSRLPVGGLFAFPMRLGAITLGVCDVYRAQPAALTLDELASVLQAVDVATLSLLSLRAGDLADEHDLGWLNTHNYVRRRVHQATGMLIAQLGLPAEQAFARLRAYAYASDRTIDDVAQDILDRRLRLDPDRA